MDLWKRASFMRDSIKSKLLHMGLQQWLVLLLLGLLLAAAAMPVSSKRKTDATGALDKTDVAEESVTKTELEAKLEQLLSNVEGVGKVEVILMTGTKSGDFYDTGEEKVTGVLIAAQGGDDFVTVEKIQQAVMALFQIEAHKIKVMKMI